MVKAEPGQCEDGVGGKANISVMFGKRVGTTGHVVAFEPVRGQFGTARDRVAPAGSITLVHAGLWSEPGETEIRIAGSASTITGSVKHNDKAVELCPLSRAYRPPHGVHERVRDVCGARLKQPAVCGLARAGRGSYLRKETTWRPR